MSPRETAFLGAYYAVTGAMALAALPLLLLPGTAPMRRMVGANVRVVRWLLRVVGGVSVAVQGRETLPDGPYILAARHESWGDGYVWLSEARTLAPLISAHALKPDLVRHLVAKAGAVVIENEGTKAARGRALSGALADAEASGRPILIFPEGRIAATGEMLPLKAGVFRLYEALGWPVVPAATNLGERWPLADGLVLKPGRATAQLLPPIEPGLDRAAFMARLEEGVHGGTVALRAGGALALQDRPVTA